MLDIPIFHVTATTRGLRPRDAVATSTPALPHDVVIDSSANRKYGHNEATSRFTQPRCTS